MGLAMTKMELTSPAFAQGERIPERHVSDGDNVSPPLTWTEPPPGTKSFALFCHDPDAPLVKGSSYGFTHWVLYNIPGDTTDLPEDAEAYTLGRNDYERRSYDGPRPPEGHGTHRYYYWLLALDAEPGLDEGLSLPRLLERVDERVLGMSRLVGRYER